MSDDVKPYRHRFPRYIIQHAIWLYHRFTLSYRDIEELLLQRGIQVSYETVSDCLGQNSTRMGLARWCNKFGPTITKQLRKREPRRGSHWHLDKVCVKMKGVKHWFFLARTDSLEQAWPLACCGRAWRCAGRYSARTP